MSGSDLKQPILLILVGLVGSGKSTFAQALDDSRLFMRCNQDELGNRRAVEDKARYGLRQGWHVCVDRTNFDASQRATWIRIAREFGALAWIAVFDTPYEVCAERLQTRSGHPTLKNPEMALGILKRFSSDYRAPEAHEGYDKIAYFKPEDLPSLPYTHDSLVAVLEQIRLSEKK